MGRIECEFLNECEIGKSCNWSMLSTGKRPKCAEQNSNSTQQLQAKIAALANEVSALEMPIYSLAKDNIISKLRQLSAVQ